MRLILVCTNQVTIERHMVAQQCVGDDPFAATEIFSRVTRFYRRALNTKFLTINCTIQGFGGKGITGENRQRGDGVADAIIGVLQRCQSQILLVGIFQHMVGNIAGTRHHRIAMVHRLRDDDSHQTVDIRLLFCIARLQRGQRGKEQALAVNKPENVSNITKR
ncbi:hypothetical protein D3C87_1403440 [compost metagenome]